MGAQNEQLKGQSLRRSGLFRSEALEHQKPTLIGAALKARPVSFQVLTTLAVSAAALVIIFGFWGEYTRKARVAGYLTPSAGLIKVYAPATGTLLEKKVVEGQQVRRGDTLFVLSTDQASARDAQVQATNVAHIQQQLMRAQRERDAQAELESSESRLLEERVRSLRLELDQLDAGLQVQQARTASARSAADRYQELFERRLITRLDVERAESDAL